MPSPLRYGSAIDVGAARRARARAIIASSMAAHHPPTSNFSLSKSVSNAYSADQPSQVEAESRDASSLPLLLRRRQASSQGHPSAAAAATAESRSHSQTAAQRRPPLGFTDTIMSEASVAPAKSQIFPKRRPRVETRVPPVILM